jgi:hypothetical protein
LPSRQERPPHRAENLDEDERADPADRTFDELEKTGAADQMDLLTDLENRIVATRATTPGELAAKRRFIRKSKFVTEDRHAETGDRVATGSVRQTIVASRLPPCGPMSFFLATKRWGCPAVPGLLVAALQPCLSGAVMLPHEHEVS